MFLILNKGVLQQGGKLSQNDCWVLEKGVSLHQKDGLASPEWLSGNPDGRDKLPQKEGLTSL